MSQWHTTDLLRRRGDKRLAGEERILFRAALDSSVVANVARGGATPTFTRNCSAYGRTLAGLQLFGANVPAIETFLDSNGATVSGYLSEEARTNTQNESENIGPTYSQVGTSYTDGFVASPISGTMADAIVEDSSDGVHRRSWDAFSVTLGSYYSIWSMVKPLARNRVQVYSANANFPADATYLLSGAGSVLSGDDAWIVAMGAGWYAVGQRNKLAIDSFGSVMFFGLQDSSGNTSYQGLNTEALAVIGPQVELGAFESSYIKTSGSPAVRVATLLRYPGGRNVADGTGQRTYVARFVVGAGRSGYLWSISDGGSADDRIYSTIEPTTGVARVRVAKTGGDAGDVAGTTDLTDGAEHEVRVLLAENNLRLIVDGAEEGTADTSVGIPQGLDRWDVGADESVANHLNGNITELRCYDGLRA